MTGKFEARLLLKIKTNLLEVHRRGSGIDVLVLQLGLHAVARTKGTIEEQGSDIFDLLCCEQRRAEAFTFLGTPVSEVQNRHALEVGLDLDGAGHTPRIRRLLTMQSLGISRSLETWCTPRFQGAYFERFARQIIQHADLPAPAPPRSDRGIPDYRTTTSSR